MAVFQYYKDKGGRWRWRLRNDEGKIIAVSGEKKKKKEECLNDLQTAREISEISEVRIYESDEEFTVYKEAPEPADESVSEPEPTIEPDKTVEPEPEPGPEPDNETEEESEMEEPVSEEEYSDQPEDIPRQPDDIPTLIHESSLTAVPEKWKRPNWALITSITAVVIIIILIILFSLREKPAPQQETLEVISEVQEPEPTPESAPPSTPQPVVEEEVIQREAEPEITKLEAKVESPELSKVQEPVPIDIFHTVVKGDRLWTLADEYYSDAYLWPNIYNANIPKIPNPDVLKIGIELLIPALEGNHLKLSDADRHKVAEGYVHAYLIYKKLGRDDAKYYLWVAQLYDQSILAEYQKEIDLEDMQIIKRYKKR